MLTHILGASLALLTTAPQDGGYRAVFDRGVEALEAGRGTEAAKHFRAAGEFAPGAPVWRSYLALAEGAEDPVAPQFPSIADRPWSVALQSQSDNAVFDSTGELLLSGRGTQALWDARTGERIATLTHRSSEHGLFWKFDETGRLIVGVGGRWSPRFGSVRGLDVRDARTGDPIDVPGAEDVAVTRDTRFEWIPTGQPPRDLTLGHVVDLPCAGGVLRCRVVPTRTNEDYLMRPDHERALLLYRQVPTELQLVDPKTGEPLALIQPGGARAWFSPSGNLAVSTNRSTSEIILLDAETGEHLSAPPLPQDREYNAWGVGFDRDQVVIVDRGGGVLHWDPRAGAEVSRMQLDPPPHAGVGVIAFADAGRVLIVHTFNWTQGYDTTTGQELWSVPDSGSLIGDALASDGLRLTVDSGSGAPEVLDVRTGEVAGGYSVHSILATRDVAVLEDTDAALLTVSDGSLRRVDLESGATTAVAEEHMPTERIKTRLIDTEHLITWVEGERLFLRNARTLEPLHSAELPEGSKVLAIAPDGSQIILRTAADLLQVRTLEEVPQAFQIRAGREHPVSAAYSPDGSRWAAGYEGHIHLFDTRTRQPISDFILRGGKIRQPVPMCFYGEDRLAIGWGWANRGLLGGSVYQLPGGQRITHLVPTLTLMMGGQVSRLRCDPDVGRITFSLVSTGYVASFNEADWSECWNVDYSGGNPSWLDLHRSGSSRRMFVSGMAPTNTRVVDVVTGEILASDALDCYSLAGTSSDRFVVGERNQALVVFEGERFTELYQRTEGPAGAAWIVRDGFQQRAAGGASELPDPRHLARYGVSRPIDCWDAWLHDPLALAPVSLNVLPAPPRISSGPPRLVEHLGDTIELELEVADGASLLGIEVETVGGEARFIPVAPKAGEATRQIKVSHTGPWPADVRLRAVNRSGVRSAPWRVRLAHPLETPRER